MTNTIRKVVIIVCLIGVYTYMYNLFYIMYLFLYNISKGKKKFIRLHLFQLSIDIGNEVKYQNKMLGEMVSEGKLLLINFSFFIKTPI